MKDILEQLRKYDLTTLKELFEPLYDDVLKSKQQEAVVAQNEMETEIESLKNKIESLKNKKEQYSKHFDEIQSIIIRHTWKNAKELMVLSRNTLKILRNFAKINPGIVIRNGQPLTTMNGAKSVVGIAEIEETFPCDVPIADLKDFLKKYSSHPNPKLGFFDDYLMIYGEGGSYTQYRLTALFVITGTIKFPEDKNIVSFIIDKEKIKQINSICSKTKAAKMEFRGTEGLILFSCIGECNKIVSTFPLYNFEGDDFKKLFEIELSKDCLMVTTNVRLSVVMKMVLWKCGIRQ